MQNSLKISVGQHSEKGRKEVNQDFYGVASPGERLTESKGIAVALADGIGSSEVSQIASEFAVMGFLDDYYCTSDAWSVKKSMEKVLTATNRWLHSRTRQSPYRYDKDRGYVCTLSGVVFKSTTAHLFHIGDTRIYRLSGQVLELLTQDHRIRVSGEKSYLSRAVGFNPQIEIDYQALQLEKGDIFLLLTDGVHEHVDNAFLIGAIRDARHDLDRAARDIVAEASRRGSDDNLTVQIVAVEELPGRDALEMHRQLAGLPLPPLLEARTLFEGYRIIRELHASHRSHIYLASDEESGELVTIKAPSVDLQADPAHLERFLMEEWVARRLNSAHVLRPCRQTRERHHRYVVMEYVDGQTLTQWLIDNPRPSVETVRGIVEQVAKGLQAFHRLEMLHQDLRPDNIMIDKAGTVRLIDFGATSVAGIAEMAPAHERDPILGTAQYSAPEYFLGESGSAASDLFSLGVITYQMLSGRLPYGAEVAKSRTAAAQRKLQYVSVLDDDREIPFWIDGVLKKAVHPDPTRRHESLSEFVFDLRHPGNAYLSDKQPPLIERHPVLFWKSVSVLLLAVILVLLFGRFGVR